MWIYAWYFAGTLGFMVIWGGLAHSSGFPKGPYTMDKLRWPPRQRHLRTPCRVFTLSNPWTEFCNSRVKHNNPDSTKLPGNPGVGEAIVCTLLLHPCHASYRHHQLINLILPLWPRGSQHQSIQVCTHRRTAVQPLWLVIQILLLASVSLWKTQMQLFCTTGCYTAFLF